MFLHPHLHDLHWNIPWIPRNKKITLGCDSANDAYINFYSNDSDTSDNLYDCKMLSHGGTSRVEGEGELTVYSKKNTLNGDIDVSQI